MSHTLTGRAPVSPVFHWFSVITVSLYLTLTFIYLRLKRQVVPPVSLLHLLKASLRQPATGSLTTFNQEEGFCFTAPLPNSIISDKEGYSKIVVYENDVPLREAHAAHADIRHQGQGRYSHWESQIYLSSSDNTDPRSNGRTYRFVEVKE